MLRFLRIRNLAVIDAVEVEFESGFNVLTGETGAGKSILVEAVGLLLGGRASSELVRTGEAQATIEAIFEAADALRTDRPSRDQRAGAKPLVHQRRAGHGGSAARPFRSARRTARAARTPGTAGSADSSPAPRRASRDTTTWSTRFAARGPRCAACASNSIAREWTGGRRPRAWS